MTYALHQGDCLDVLPTLPANSVDTVITDPPYGYDFAGKDWDHGVPGVQFWREVLRVAKPGAHLLAFGGARTYHRLTCAIEDAGWEVRDCLMWLYAGGFPKSHNLRMDGWSGWGTALKPAWEPIILAMKPLDSTFVQNAQAWGVSGLNVDGGRVNGSHAGRWPANVLLDEEAAAGVAWARYFYCAKASRAERNAGLEGLPQVAVSIGDERPSGGSWERRGDRKAGGPQANTHPTVKPLALMRYLCKLTATPTGGVVLDPFMGSGTTGVAALQEGRNFIGIELDAGYCEIARRRIEAAAPVAANQEASPNL